MQRLATTAAIALIVCASLAGCTNSQVLNVVQDIGIYAQQAEPIIVALIPIITALKAGQEDAATIASINQFGVLAKTDLDVLSQLCAAYAAAPDAATYARITAAVDAFASNADAAVLAANRVADPATRQRIVLAIASLDALAHIMDGFIQTTQKQTVVAAKAQSRAVKLRDVAGYWSPADRSRVSAAFSAPFGALIAHETQLGL